jgi:hypothetical protein
MEDPPEMYADIKEYKNNTYKKPITILIFFPKIKLDILIIFVFPGNQREISNIANAEKVIQIHTHKNIEQTKYISIPIVLIGNPNIPAPIDVPDINKIEPTILLKII